MKENIYRLLNEVEMDLADYKDRKLSSEEKEKYKQRILQEVSRMKDREIAEKRKAKPWKIAAGMAAALAITIGAVGIANPVLAQNVWDSVFGKLVDNAKGEKDEKEITDLYTKIRDKSVSAEQELDKHQDKEEYRTTAKSNGVTISIDDIYCDGYVLYYTSSLYTEREGLLHSDGILAENKVGRGQIEIDGLDMSGYSKAFEKAEDGSYVSVYQIDLMSGADENVLWEKEGNTLIVDWMITNLKGNLWDSWDEYGNYMVTENLEGEWHLRFPVTVDVSGNETYVIDKEENGIIVKEAIKTKTGLVIHVQLPDFRKDPYNDSYNDPNIAIKDGQGKYLQWMSQREITKEDGTSECWIMVLYNDEQEVALEVSTREEEEREIAEIRFQVP